MRASLPSRLLSALPDAGMAAFFGLLWIAPTVLAPGAIKTGMLIMLVEFILIHASALLGSMLLGEKASTRQKLGVMLGLGALYLLFIAAFALAFQQWWPIVAFVWLMLGKASLAFDRGLPNAERQHRLQATWAASCLFYIVGVFLTVFLPVPRLGITHAVVSAAQLPGSGLWVDRPQTVIAFGFVYFAALAWIKSLDWRLPTLPKPASRRMR